MVQKVLCVYVIYIKSSFLDYAGLRIMQAMQDYAGYAGLCRIMQVSSITTAIIARCL